MKLLLCCEHYYPSIGGVQEVMRQIAERLVAKGHEVIVATSRHSLRPIEYVHNGVVVRSFIVSGNLVRGIKGNIQEFHDYILQGNFDALLVKAAQQWTFDALLPIIKKFKGRKIFIPCGFSGLYLPEYKNYFQQMPDWLTYFDKLIFYTENYRDINFAIEHGLSNFELIPNGADEREFGPTLDEYAFRKTLGIGDNDFLFLSVGSLTGAKGHWEVAKAFQKLKLNRPATLILNGNFNENSIISRLRRIAVDCIKMRFPLALLSRLINSRFYPEKKILLLDLPRSDLVKAFKSADLFIFASYIEYSPLVLFECLAAGLPFISTPVGNANEIVSWSNGGRILETPLNKKGLAIANVCNLARDIQKMCSNEPALREMGKNGRATFLKRGLSWNIIVQKYEKILLNN